jgi:hypothetical protein
MGFLSRLLPTSKLDRIKRELLQAVRAARPAGIELKEEPRLAAVITALLQSPEGATLGVVRSGDTVTLCHRADLDGGMSADTQDSLRRGGFIYDKTNTTQLPADSLRVLLGG